MRESGSPIAQGAPALVIAPLAYVRYVIARAVHGCAALDDRLGDVVLHPHQVSAVRRISALLDREGGALLADAVGLGKTYTALAAAATRGTLLIVAPAALRPMWLDAMARTGVHGEIVSFESASRGRAVPDHHRIVIIDEAHHVRNPSTTRYDRVARACARADVLLLSATPIHNSRADVRAVLALFLGSRAYELTRDEVARFVVRRTETADAPALPAVRYAVPRIVIHGEAMLDAIVALPPPLPPRDGASTPQLLTVGLVRQWISSTAALAAALRRRIGRGESLLGALERGRYPTAHELSAWTCSEDAVQLAFADLLPSVPQPLGELAAAVRAHIDGARALRAMIAHDTTDAERAAYICEIAAAHPGERIVAFTEYAETAHALYRALRHRGRVAMLAAQGGLVAGGRLTRPEVLERFAPRANGVAAPRAAEEITVLIATDLLSEGVNLQDASVVVHLDLPWTSTRLTQRVGRVARLGSAYETVTVYTIDPPRRADAWLRAHAIVAAKERASARMIGPASGAVTQGEREPVSSPVGSAERIREMLRAVARAPADLACVERDGVDSGDPSIVCAAACVDEGAGYRAVIAVQSSAGVTLLVQHGDHAVSAAPTVGEHAVHAMLAGTECVCDDARARDALAAAREWLTSRDATAAAGVATDRCAADEAGAGRASRARRTMVRHASVHASTPYARRAALAELAGRIRTAAARSIPIAIEREVRELSAGSVSTTDTTRLVALLDRLETRERRGPSNGPADVVAIVTFTHRRDAP